MPEVFGSESAEAGGGPSKPFILYHMDQDGHAAALAAYERFGPEATYIPVEYGEPMPEIPDGAKVYILDFSYPRAELIALNNRVSKLVVIDHHESAARELEGLEFAIFHTERAACVLAWQYFHVDSEVPALFLRVEDRDLWRFKLADTKEVYAYLLTLGRDLVVWRAAMHQYAQDPASIGVVGRELLGFMTQAAELLATEAGPMQIGNKIVVAVNVALVWLQSQVADILLRQHSDVAFVVVWRQRADGSRVFNLRSTGSTNVAKIAEKFGGGGHKKAAGFVLAAPKEPEIILPAPVTEELPVVLKGVSSDVAGLPIEAVIGERVVPVYPLELTAHHPPGFSRDCTIKAHDRPGPNGGSSHYTVEWFNVRPGEPTTGGAALLQFHQPSDQGGQNGLFIEDVLAILAHRLEGLQTGSGVCSENLDAIEGIGAALGALHEASVYRMRQAVLDID